MLQWPRLLGMVNTSVLVLNQNYEPLNVCRARRAVVLVWRGKAETLENGRGEIRALHYSLPLPSVVRLLYLIKRPRLEKRLTRAMIFSRDRYTCQYCGRETRELTLDHVIPRHLGGQHIWENVVSACKACNLRKAGRLPQAAGVKLLRQPSAPRLGSLLAPQLREEWLKFLAWD